MIPIEQAMLAKALLGLTTNSETQAERWAGQILEELRELGFKVVPLDEQD